VIAIAPMRPEDVDEVARLEAEAFAARDGAHASGALPPEPHTQAARLREELARPWARLWVAREPGDARIVAFVLIWHVVDEVHVLDVATHVGFRRRGIARALLQHVERFAAEHRARHVLLEVRRSNRAAIALYRALRFFALGIRARYYSDGEDAIEMMLALDPETGAVVQREDEVQLPPPSPSDEGGP